MIWRSCPSADGGQNEFGALGALKLRLHVWPVVITAAALVLYATEGCSATCSHMDFSTWKQADHIVVRRMSKTIVKTIGDAAVIAEIADFAQARTTGWGIPAGGTPVPEYTLDFYAGDRFLGHLGLDKTFIESQGCDDFVVRKIGDEDRRMIGKLVGLPDTASR
jgi:hypothetical protein